MPRKKKTYLDIEKKLNDKEISSHGALLYSGLDNIVTNYYKNQTAAVYMVNAGDYKKKNFSLAPNNKIVYYKIITDRQTVNYTSEDEEIRLSAVLFYLDELTSDSNAKQRVERKYKVARFITYEDGHEEFCGMVDVTGLGRVGMRRVLRVAFETNIMVANKEAKQLRMVENDEDPLITEDLIKDLLSKVFTISRNNIFSDLDDLRRTSNQDKQILYRVLKEKNKNLDKDESYQNKIYSTGIETLEIDRKNKKIEKRMKILAQFLVGKKEDYKAFDCSKTRNLTALVNKALNVEDYKKAKKLYSKELKEIEKEENKLIEKEEVNSKTL